MKNVLHYMIIICLFVTSCAQTRTNICYQQDLEAGRCVWDGTQYVKVDHVAGGGIQAVHQYCPPETCGGGNGGRDLIAPIGAAAGAVLGYLIGNKINEMMEDAREEKKKKDVLWSCTGTIYFPKSVEKRTGKTRVILQEHVNSDYSLAYHAAHTDCMMYGYTAASGHCDIACYSLEI